MIHIKRRKGEIEIYKSISLALCPKYSIIENIFIQNGENCIFGIAFILVLEYNRIIKTRSEKP